MWSLSRPAYAQGQCDIPLRGETIGRMWNEVVAAYGGRPALVARHQGIRWTYAELHDEVERCARALLAAGVAKGDRVGIWSPNNAEWVIVQFATAKIGAILVNVNPSYRAHELEYALRQSGCTLLILAPGFKDADYRELLAGVDTPDLRRSVVLGEQWDELLAAAEGIDAKELGPREAQLDFDEPINIQYTSGTTGFPKGATLSHHNILNNGFFIGEILGYTPEDRVCIPVPFYHCFGMVLGNLAVVTHGACIVLPSEAFDARAVLETVAEERCTSLYGVPTMFIAELAEPDFSDFDLTSLRTGIMAGSPCPVEEVKVVDPETGRTVARGETGELCTRGYCVMLGYWNDEAATREAIDEARWMHTGDLAVMDDEGYVNIVGRIKDMIIRGGENIYPREIEEFLYTHPAIADVQVIGVPDERYGEVVCAWIVLKGGAELDEHELKEFCRGKIARFKIPHYVR